MLGGVGLVEVVDPRSIAVIAAAFADRQPAKAARVSYAATYRRLVALAGPGAGVEDLTAELVARYRNVREAEGRAPATIARELSAVRVLVRAVGASATP